MSGRDPNATSVQVNIFNQTYSLRSNSSGERIKQIAKFVDERMQQVSSHTTTHDVAKIAILAALNIANELQTLKDYYENESQASDSQSAAKSDATAPAGEGSVVNRQEETEQQSWFDALFDSKIPVKNREDRLSSQVSAKLQSRRQPDLESLAIEAGEGD